MKSDFHIYWGICECSARVLRMITKDFHISRLLLRHCLVVLGGHWVFLVSL